MHKAKKSLGQNFLKDQNVLQEIIEAAEIKPGELILEIGPGKGALTNHLLEAGGRVLALELDEDLIPILEEAFGKDPHFSVIHQDALNYAPKELGKVPYKIVANLPYYITSPLINHYLLDQFLDGIPPQSLVIMVQKEVAEKILAQKHKHSLLSLQVALFGEVEWICTVPSQAFEPAPKVDSAVIKITVAPAPKIKADLKKLFKLFHMSFAQKRKKLSNNLAATLRKKPQDMKDILESIPLNPNLRAEDLTLNEWDQLYLKLETQL